MGAMHESKPEYHVKHSYQDVKAIFFLVQNSVNYICKAKYAKSFIEKIDSHQCTVHAAARSIEYLRLISPKIINNWHSRLVSYP